jgi:dipeptidyl aminopeptidase B
MTDTSEPSYYAVSFSPAGGYYTLAYQGPNIPYQKLITANGTGEWLPGLSWKKFHVADCAKLPLPDNGIILEDNAALNETSQQFQFPIKSYTTIMSDGVGESNFGGRSGLSL